jgi:hypothetical protein
VQLNYRSAAIGRLGKSPGNWADGRHAILLAEGIWRGARHGVTAPSTPRSVTELERENRELRAKLADMEVRERVLKKSLGILSEAPGSSMPKWKR